MAKGAVAQRLRNLGFTFTDEQRLARWQDIGGPRPLERWGLQGPFHHRLVTFLTLAPGLLGIPLILGWWRADESAFSPFFGALLGLLFVIVFFDGAQYRRERDLYDRWIAGERAIPR